MTVPAKKSLGQHWLDDMGSLNAICKLADVQPGQTVLEIGPGHGSLTKQLLARGANVIAVEFDNELIPKLQSKFAGQNLTVKNEDILAFDLTTLPASYKVVANIPYYLTSNLIRVLCESTNPPSQITLLVQKEVAERLCAVPGEMSVLAVAAQLYYACEIGPIVEAEKFSPPPKVDSQIVNMLSLSKPLIARTDSKQFFRLVKAGFSNRRKTLLNSLSGGLQLTKDEIQDALLQTNIDPTARAQELSLENWLKLNKYLTR